MVFLEISQNIQENACARNAFLIKLQALACNFIKKESLAQAFSCVFCEISKNTFFTEHLRTTAWRPLPRLIKPGDITEKCYEKAIHFHGTFHGLKITNCLCNKQHLNKAIFEGQFIKKLSNFESKPKARTIFLGSWWSGNEKYSCILFIASRAPLKKHAEFNNFV